MDKPPPSFSQGESERGARLDSWKEIAAYLKRDRPEFEREGWLNFHLPQGVSHIPASG
jgi:hypothetical protein